MAGLVLYRARFQGLGLATMSASYCIVKTIPVSTICYSDDDSYTYAYMPISEMINTRSRSYVTKASGFCLLRSVNAYDEIAINILTS